jgi:uncharacterized protein DUF1707
MAGATIRGMTDPQHMRVSDAEREQILAKLGDSMANGLIDTGEFDERSGKAVAARTRGELEAIVADLPAAPGATNDVVELRGTSSSLKRKGNWVVPRTLVLDSRMGSTELDFTEATIEHPVVDIELAINGGSVELRLPEGASATTDGVEVTKGSVEDHRKNPPAVRTS